MLHQKLVEGVAPHVGRLAQPRHEERWDTWEVKRDARVVPGTAATGIRNGAEGTCDEALGLQGDERERPDYELRREYLARAHERQHQGATDPELIHERYRSLVDIVIDGGYGHNIASTVIDCTGSEPVIVRQGIGIIEI